MKKLDDYDDINEMIDKQDDVPISKPKRKHAVTEEAAPEPSKPQKKAPKFDNLSLKQPAGDDVY